MFKSYKPEVQTDDSGKWYGNACRFATYDEAYASALSLMARWLLVRDCRAVQAEEPVNYRHEDGQDLRLGLEPDATPEAQRGIAL